MTVNWNIENCLGADEFIDVLQRSGPGVEDYYLHTGFEKFETCYGIRRKG